MDELLKFFGSKTALSNELGISCAAVVRAFSRGKVPNNWIPTLKKSGMTTNQIKGLPLSGSGNEIVNSLTKG